MGENEDSSFTPTQAKQAEQRLRSIAERLTTRLDVALQQAGSKHAALTGKGVALSYLFVEETRDATQAAAEQIKALELQIASMPPGEGGAERRAGAPAEGTLDGQ